MDWRNHFKKNPIQKIKKTVKNQSQIAECEQKTTTEKHEFLFKHRFLILL